MESETDTAADIATADGFLGRQPQGKPEPTMRKNSPGSVGRDLEIL